MKFLIPGLLLLFTCLPVCAQAPVSFSWDRATIAFVEPELADPSVLLSHLKDGYFTEHRIDVLRLASFPPPGDTMEQASLYKMIDAAHNAGLRVVADVAIRPADTLATGAMALVKQLAGQVGALRLDGICLEAAHEISPRLASALKAASVGAFRAWQTRKPDPSSGAPDFWMAAMTEAPVSDLPPAYDAVFEPLAMDAEEADQDPFVALTARSDSFQRVAFAASDEMQNTLLLFPGPIQVTYTGEEADTWAKALLHFRHRHPALAGGLHEQINETPYAFHRVYRYGLKEDHVIVVMEAAGRTRLNVSRIFPNDTALRDTITGKIAIVSYGLVSFSPDEQGMLLIEEVE